MIYVNYYQSPIGPISIASEKDYIIGIWFENSDQGNTPFPKCDEGNSVTPIVLETFQWLNAYFQETILPFPKFRLIGTPFQIDVWEELLKVPFGASITYGQLASALAIKLGRKTMSAQAIGQALSKNPICILVPCHRVLGSGNKLTGYVGGIKKKAYLLDHESIEYR